MNTEQLAELDNRFLWHPFTQQRYWEEDEQLFIERGEGTDLYDTNGNVYIDGVSSLWCNVHGHCHPTIDKAVEAQLAKIAHSTMLGLSHPPAVKLAEQLVGIAPDGLTRVFYSDNGSTACEIALKMAFQFWQQSGQPARTSYIYLENSYHGDTVGSVSVGGIDTFHSLYRPLLFEAFPAKSGDLSSMESLLKQHGERIAAVIVEPLVQGAAGMLLQPNGYLRGVRELCDRYGTLLICDEVATGFGRTGTMFACEQEQVSPDLLCLAKGLTGGYLPLAATLATENIYNAFLGEHRELKTFFHGHTYTGNPLACAAALATLEVFEQEQTLQKLESKIELLGKLLKKHVAELPTVAEIRRRGFMCGIELTDFPLEKRMGHRVTLAARKRGVIVRPLGDVVVLMPPLSISEEDLERLVTSVSEAIEEVTTGT